MNAAPAGARVRLGALGHRDYLLFVVGNATSLVGSWTHRVAAGWLAWEMTGSAVWLGLIAFADLFPTLVFGPFSGIVADRFSKLAVLKASQIIAVIPALGMIGLSLLGVLDIWLLFVFTFLLGSAQAMEQPARLALVSELVGREQMRSAVAINSITFNLARFAGPAIAGIIIAVSTTAVAFAVNGLSFLVFLAILHVIRTVTSAPATVTRTGILSELMDGLRYVGGHPGLYLVLFLIGALNLCARPILELLPAFSEVQFNSDATGFALLSSAVGLGAMVGGLGLTVIGRHWSNTWVALISGAGILLTSLIFVALPWLWAGAVCIAALGVFFATSGIAAQSMIQMSTAPNMRGRVLSIYGLLFRAAPAVGGLIMGYMSELFGLTLSVVLSCALITAALVYAANRRHEMLAMESSEVRE